METPQEHHPHRRRAERRLSLAPAVSAIGAAARATALAAVLVPATFAAPAAAQTRESPREQARWEVGGGFSPLYLPDYRGSDQSRGYLLPFPYVIYRGERLRVDRQRARTLIIDSDKVELDLSVNASLPVRSSRNDARRGMPNLDPVWELGPSLKTTLWEAVDRKSDLSFRLPLRAAVASDFTRASGAGFTATPTIGVDFRDQVVFGSRGWNYGLLAGALFATRGHFDYVYSVDPAFATATRPAYQAGGGYGGWQLTATFSKRWDGFWLGGFVRYDSVAGASFEPSPLVRQTHNVWAGFAMAWVLWESAEKIDTGRWRERY